MEIYNKNLDRLHLECNLLYINNTVAYGTFLALKPFYV